MPTTTLVAGSQGTFFSQPTDTPLIARSSSAADTGNLSFFGNVAGSPDNETVALAGTTEVVTTKSFQTISRLSLASAAAGTVSVWGGGQKAQGDILVASNPADGDQVAILNGAAGNTYTFKNTPAGPLDVQIGGDEATTADNLRAVIDGQDQLVDASVTAGTGAVVIITDKVPIARGSAWNVNQPTGATLSIRQPVGGQTGALIAEMAPGQTQVHAQVSLNTPDLSENTLPGSFVFTSDWVGVQGAPWTIELRSTQDAGQFSSPSVEIANDQGTVLRTQVLALGSGALNALLPLNDIFPDTDYNTALMRLKITNSQAVDVPLHAAVTWEP